MMLCPPSPVRTCLAVPMCASRLPLQPSGQCSRTRSVLEVSVAARGLTVIGQVAGAGGGAPGSASEVR